MYTYKQLYMNVYSRLICNSKNWKESKCPSTAEWISKFWYIHTMEYYSAIKKEQTTDTHNKVDESQNDHAELKEPEKRRIYNI